MPSAHLSTLTTRPFFFTTAKALEALHGLGGETNATKNRKRMHQCSAGDLDIHAATLFRAAMRARFQFKTSANTQATGAPLALLVVSFTA